MGCSSLYIDAITAVAAVLAAAAAWSGVSAWRRELKGKASFEAARNLMRSVYKAREGIRYVRSRLVLGSEFPSGYVHSTGSSYKGREEKASAYGHVFKRRWEYLRPAVEEIEAHRLEAEVLLGKEVAEKTEAFLYCIRRLQVSIESYIEDIINPGPESEKEYSAQLRQDVFDTYGDKNVLSNEIKGSIAALESVLLKHMKES